MKILILGITFFLVGNCSNIKGTREECYEKNYCSTAFSDCMTGFYLISSMSTICKQATTQSSSFSYMLFCDATFN